MTLSILVTMEYLSKIFYTGTTLFLTEVSLDRVL
nr:MAG TPA: hypothetical protein [Caudoviricetes sp.]